MKTIIAFMLMLCLPAAATMPREQARTYALEAAVDERLSQTITVTETGDRLAAVLDRLSEKTGVRFTAQKNLADTLVVVRYTGTLGSLMEALSHFFAPDKEKVNRAFWSWKETGDLSSRVYKLERFTPAGPDAVRELRLQREEAVTRAMDQAIRDGHKWLHRLSALTDAERTAFYGGAAVSRHVEVFGGRRFIEETMKRDAPNWSDNVTVTWQLMGRSPLTRMIDFAYTDHEHGTTAREGFALAQIFPQFMPEAQQADWRARYGDPAPTGGKSVTVRPEPTEQGQETPRRLVLLRIAEKAGINLIADDAGQTLAEDRQPAHGTVAELLDAACAFQWGSGESNDTNHGSFWRKCGDCYLVRSLAWPEEEGR